MPVAKIVSLIAALLVGALFLSQSLAADPQTEGASKPAQVGTLPAIGRVSPKSPSRLLLTGKRPPIMSARPAWMGTLAASTLFMARFEQAFERLDKNHDGLLKWAWIDAQGKLHANQAGAEPLPASYDACYLIDYVHHPAKSEKDPAHPGQYIETPEAYEITGWRTWKEVLAEVSASGYPAQTPTGVCNKTEHRMYCRKAGMEVQPNCIPFGGCTCPQGFTPFAKDVCVDPETVPSAFTKAQWLKLAQDHIQREDWNHDGKLDATESAEYVCPAE